MSEPEGWKRYLLSSGVPLEHDVAQTLVEAGFAVSPEFPYLRHGGNEEKEFSVDLEAKWFGPTDEDISYSLNLLVECKYRSPDKVVMLFEDPDTEPTNGTLGHTIAAIDLFAPYNLKHSVIYNFESNIPFTYKALEIHKGVYPLDVRAST